MVGQVIRKKLYDAATQGDAATFQEILQEDPYLLDVVSFPCSRNLLHIATMRGQVSIVEEVLKINPRLAWSLDSHKSSPLHIAATEGKVEIASKLLPIAPEMCWLRDCHGMNPVHIAAMNGHVEILEEIIRHDPSPAREKVDRGQTALHLCVKRGQLRILQALVNNNLGELIHVEDDDGETVLHWAVRYKQVEIVRYLLEISRSDYQYSRNSKGITALGISLSSPGSDTTHSEITKILKQANTVKAELHSMKMGKDVAVVVAILIAGMTFQAAISPPGGTWQDDSSTHKAGTAIMASIDPESYQGFLTTNTAAFVGSLITIMLLIISPLTDRASLLAVATGLSCSVLFFSVSFITCATVLTPHTKYHYTVNSTAISIYISTCAIYPYILYLEPKLVGPRNKFVAGLHMVVVKLSLFIDKYVRVWRETGN